MNPFNRSPPSTNFSSQLITELRTQSGKLKQIAFKLRKRDSFLLEMCTRAIEREERARAKIFANELAQVRTMLNTIAWSELAIERVVIRLENYVDLRNLFADLKPTVKVIQSLTGPLARFMPGITNVMGRLDSLVNDTLIETKLEFSQLPTGNLKTLESEEILKEVSEHIEQKLKINLPEPPTLVSAQKKATKEERKAVPIAVG